MLSSEFEPIFDIWILLSVDMIANNGDSLCLILYSASEFKTLILPWLNKYVNPRRALTTNNLKLIHNMLIQSVFLKCLIIDSVSDYFILLRGIFWTLKRIGLRCLCSALANHLQNPDSTTFWLFSEIKSVLKKMKEWIMSGVLWLYYWVWMLFCENISPLVHSGILFQI